MNTIAERSPLYDNAKAVLMFTVILGHICEYVHTPFILNIFKFIYLFHMPCFVFISGFFAKKGKNYKQIISQYLSLVIVFQVLYSAILISLGTFFGLKLFFTAPYVMLWYLLSLSYWVFSLNFLNDKYLKYLIFISFLLAIFLGMSSFIERSFSIGRTFYFWPFFLMGYYFKRHNLTNTFFNNKFLKKISVVLLVILVCLILTLKIYLPYDIHAYYGWVPFKSLGLNLKEGLKLRLIMLSEGCLLSFLALNCIPNRNTFFTKFGRKTLSIFLFHYVFVLLISKFILPQLNLSPYMLLALIISSSLVIYYITSLNFLNDMVLWIPKKVNKILGMGEKPNDIKNTISTTP